MSRQVDGLYSIPVHTIFILRLATCLERLETQKESHDCYSIFEATAVARFNAPCVFLFLLPADDPYSG